MPSTNAPTLYLLCGKIAAGKSTLARRLAARPATLLVGEDHWMSTLFAVPDAVCKQRLRDRNEAGAHPYQVSDAEYDLFTRHFVPPGSDEGFNIVVHTP